MLVDAHCHLLGRTQDPDNPEALMARARAAGVEGFVAVATGPEEYDAVLALARRHPEVCASLGLHPHEARAWTEDGAAALEALLADPEARFVGETGLDFHYDLSPRDVQAEVFRAHIRLARRVCKPLMIHTRAAAAETLVILEEEGAREVGGVIHCFSEDRAFAARALDLGFHLSFSGIVTFPRKAEAIREVAAWAPLDRILVETDTPYLAPVPHRGKPNEPAYVVHVAEALAHLRGIPLEVLASHTTSNLEALCGWSPCS